MDMVTLKKLFGMIRKLNRKMGAAYQSSKSSVVDKGFFVIYTMDKRRFVIPLAFLNNSIFVELLRMSEEEFGLPSDRPITFPYDSVAMNYIVSLLKRGLAKNLEKAVLNCILSHRCSSDTYFDLGPADHQQSVLCGF